MYGQSQPSQFDKVLSQIKSNKPNETIHRHRAHKQNPRTNSRNKRNLADELSHYFLDA